jgi:hypothetical protein
MDESTDVNDVAQLAVFIWGCGSEVWYYWRTLELIPMHGITTGEDIFCEGERQTNCHWMNFVFSNCKAVKMVS